MLLDKLYSFLHKSSLYGASAYCIARSNRVIEVMFLNKVIVNIRALAMPLEQVVDLLRTGDFKNVNVIPKETSLESINHTMVEKIFPLAADHLFDPSYMSIPYVVRMLDIMEHIAGKTVGGGIDPAFAVMAETLGQRCPGFSFAQDSILQRLGRFENMLGTPLPAFQKQSAPAEGHQMLSWTLGRAVSNDPLMQAFMRYFLFWGESSAAFSKVFIREDKGSDHHQGMASISPQGEFIGYGAINLYKGLNKAGNLKLEEKTIRYIAPEARLVSSGQDKESMQVELMVGSGDMRSMGIRNGETIACLLE